MNTSINYPTFRYNNESLVLLPGSRFTKKELISRLHQMNIDSSNIQDKNSLVNLYESSLHNNLNKTKILDKLRKDTEILNSKLGISQRQSLQASNMNTMSNNSKSKVINITTEVKPFTTINNNNNDNANNNNIREINMKNRGEVTYNPLMSHNSNVQSNKTSRFGGYSNNDNNDNRNSYNDNYLNSGNFQNNNNLSNNSSKRYTNTGNAYYNNQNESNYQNNFDNSMNTGMNNNNNILNKSNMNNMNNILNKSNMNNMNNNNDMYRSRAYNNNNNNNNNSQYYAQGANTDINTSNSNRYNPVNNRNSNRYSNDSNNNYSARPSQYQDESIFASGNNTNPYRSNNLNTTNYTTNYASTNNNSVMNMNNNNQNRMVTDSQREPVLSTGEFRMQNNSNIRQREPDEESNFSIFSTFKNSPLFKDREEICKNLIISLIIIIFAIVTLSLAIKFWDSITNFFYEFFNMLLDPRRLIVDGIFGFISSLFFGSIHYFYITFPLIAIIIFLVIYIRKYNIKKNCEKIYKKMYQDLVNGQNNNEMNFIYEDDLYKKYAANFGISEKEFKRSYLPVLNKMRRRENKMKVSEQRDNNGKKVVFWHLNNN